MDNTNSISDRLQKLNELKLLLSDIDNKLLLLTKEFNWDLKKLSEEEAASMVICSINPQHRVPSLKIKIHEQKCALHHKGYLEDDQFFPECSGAGSFVTLTPEKLDCITKQVPSYTGGCFSVPLCIYSDGIELKSYPFTYLHKKLYDYDKIVLTQVTKKENKLREVPQTSANFDQNFNREEKLAIYDYVIANTQKQKSYSDLWLQQTEKSEEKREMTAWEIAAAERDSKRRRASYRNKVHTNRKTHTEILREVIEAQMEMFREEGTNEKACKKMERNKSDYKKSSHESREGSDRHQNRYHETSGDGNKEDKDKRRNHERHSKHRNHKRSPPDTGSDIKSRSRSHDKYRKWKTYEGRSHSHRSSHTHKRT